MAWPTTSRHQRGYGSAWDRQRLAILARDKHICRCAECVRLGRVRNATQVDHVVPRGRHGTDDPSNLQAINRQCHKIKTQQEQGRPMRERPVVGLDGFPVEPSKRGA